MQTLLSRGDIRLLRYLSTQRVSTPSKLSETTGLRRATISRGLSLLSDLGLVQAERKGRAKIVGLSDAKHTTLMRNMIVHNPNLRYELLLNGKSLDVLAAIHLLNLCTVKEIEQFSQVSHVTVIALLSRYKELGVVRKRNMMYGLGARYGMLGDFLREFRSYTNLRTLQQEAPDAAVVWERDRDVLFRSSNSLEGRFQSSAFSAFPRFGVDLFLAGGGYFFYSPRREPIGPAESVLHAILAAESPRERTLILIMMKKADFKADRLQWLSRVYGAEALAQAYLEYLETMGRIRQPGFPDWREFSRRMGEYA